jgi:CheY-like chemotaxis protein
VNAATKNAPQERRPLTILVADDEEDAVTTLAAILEDQGHIVHTVTHGAKVIEAIERFKPEVCFIDIQMPGRSGYDLAREISTTNPSERPMLIAISGKWTTSTEPMLARAVGFDHSFLKPAQPEMIIAVLDAIRARP